jgi:hypothetical protein
MCKACEHPLVFLTTYKPGEYKLPLALPVKPVDKQAERFDRVESIVNQLIGEDE